MGKRGSSIGGCQQSHSLHRFERASINLDLDQPGSEIKNAWPASPSRHLQVLIGLGSGLEISMQIFRAWRLLSTIACFNPVGTTLLVLTLDHGDRRGVEKAWGFKC